MSLSRSEIRKIAAVAYRAGYFKGTLQAIADGHPDPAGAAREAIRNAEAATREAVDEMFPIPDLKDIGTSTDAPTRDGQSSLESVATLSSSPKEE